MVSEELSVQIAKLKVKPGDKINLKDFATDYKGKEVTKQEGEELLEAGRRQLSEMQDKLYAHNQHGVLIIFQAMDAAGKDGAVKHVLSGVNPLGVKIHSFKSPNSLELDHDYLWRHSLALPGRGEMAIHNRSHYENVLVTRVHPEYIMKENIPGIDTVDQIDEKFWDRRYKQINRFEKNITQNGTVILKFFLHVSKKEQRKRLVSRIDDPAKNWKFELNDLRERRYWDQYQQAYEEAISATSQKSAPWFVIPADNKWYARLCIAAVIHKQLELLDLQYPTVSDKQREALLEARKELTENHE